MQPSDVPPGAVVVQVFNEKKKKKKSKSKNNSKDNSSDYHSSDYDSEVDEENAKGKVKPAPATPRQPQD